MKPATKNYNFRNATECFWVASKHTHNQQDKNNISNKLLICTIDGSDHIKKGNNINYSQIKSFWSRQEAEEFLLKLSENGYNNFEIVKNHLF